MTLFHYLQLQEVEPEDALSELDYFEHDDIGLYDQPDGDHLSSSWSKILSDSSEQV